MKTVIEGNLPHWLYKKWLNSVRVTLGLADESEGFLRYYGQFRQKITLYMFCSNDKINSTTSARGVLFKLQQVISIQIPIASELRKIYHINTRFRPSTII